MDIELATSLPKAVLHDHLDGGLRATTMLELAAESGYDGLPATDSSLLDQAMHQGDSGSLVSYLDSFRHTVALMQTADAIERVAYEAAIDHHAAGVVYAEIRFGPALMTEQGLSCEQAIDAALWGLQRAEKEVPIQTSVIISALRHHDNSERVATAATSFVGEGVVGFDLAGPAIGHPADDHLPAINRARQYGLGITLHAGEAAGPESIGTAVGKCGAQRIGHGVRIIEDCRVQDGSIVDLGLLAQRVMDQRIPLEVAISSNLDTGVARDAVAHPFGLLHHAGFNVSINTDNRLMSGIDMASEVALAANAFQLSIDDLAAITRRTIEAGFGAWPRRQRILDDALSSYRSFSSIES